MNNPQDSSHSQFGTAPALDPDAEIIAALRNRFVIEGDLTKSETRLVYLARDLKRPGGGQDGADFVSLRVLPKSLAGDPRQAEIFRLEARAGAKLSHPNILKTSEAEEMSGVLFSVEEVKRDARTLRDHLKMQGWLSTDEALRIGRQIADCLEYAHGQGVLHLTLDPEKILLQGDGTALVTGFGIGRYRDMMWAQQERSHGCAAQYISPEQILSAEVDQRSDLYLLGLVLFEMLTDRPPFECGDRASLTHKHLTRTPPAPDAFRPGLSREVSRLVLSLLGKRPDERPFDVGVFKSALDQCIASGLTADEQEEEAEGSALSDEISPQPAQFMDGLPALTQMPAEEDEINRHCAAPEESWESNVDDSEFGASRAAETEIFQDPHASYEPDLTLDNRFADLSESERERIIKEQVAIDDWKQTLQENREYGERDLALAEEKSKKSALRPLAWLIVLLVFGGMLVWGGRAIQHKGKPVGLAPTAVAGVVSESVAPPSEANSSTPAPEPISQLPPKEVTTRIEAMNPPPGEVLAAAKEEYAFQKDRHVEISGKESSPPKKPDARIPPVPDVEPASMKSSIPSGVFAGDVPSQSAPQQPAPAPERAVKVEAQATKVVRKSGDVLQNTAIIRQNPSYPKAAREAGVKGAITVEVTIDEEGSVINARPISGPEPLREAAAAAALRWKWIPTKVDRSRAKVVGTITFHFKP